MSLFPSWKPLLLVLDTLAVKIVAIILIWYFCWSNTKRWGARMLFIRGPCVLSDGGGQVTMLVLLYIFQEVVSQREEETSPLPPPSRRERAIWLFLLHLYFHLFSIFTLCVSMCVCVALWTLWRVKAGYVVDEVFFLVGWLVAVSRGWWGLLVLVVRVPVVFFFATIF